MCELELSEFRAGLYSDNVELLGSAVAESLLCKLVTAGWSLSQYQQVSYGSCIDLICIICYRNSFQSIS
jgi:hypothetical protein